MPLIDSDTAVMKSATRQGTNQAPTNMEVTIEWKDVNGVSKGVFTVSWSNLAELQEFCAAQDFSDVVRAVMGQCLQRADGTFRRAQFDALTGKTFQINQRVTQV